MNTQAFIEKYVPKKYHEAIEDIETPAEGGEGYWVYLKDGWLSTDTDSHTIHEYTIADLKKQFKYIEESFEDKKRAESEKLEGLKKEALLEKNRTEMLEGLTFVAIRASIAGFNDLVNEIVECMYQVDIPANVRSHYLRQIFI